jgi:hypothetical protein
MSKYNCDKCSKKFCSIKTLDTHKNKFHCLEISNELSTDNKILFNNVEIKYFKHDNNIYYKAKVIANILGYVDTKDAIITHVSKNDKFTVSNLKKELSSNWCNETKNILETEDPKTIYINDNGLKSLILKSNKVESIDLAKQLNIKYLKKIEIIAFLEPFLKKLNLVYIFEKPVNNYKIDLYLSNNNIAIDINRNTTHDKNRENTIKSILNCKFLRINPDTQILADCIADITQIIYSDIDLNTCCVCYENSELRKLPSCNHELCDACYYKLNDCPQCRTYYGNYKQSDSLFNVVNNYLDKFKKTVLSLKLKIKDF